MSRRFRNIYETYLSITTTLKLDALRKGRYSHRVQEGRPRGLRRGMSDSLQAHDLVGSQNDDPAGLRSCANKGFLGLSPGLRIEDWDRPERIVQAPPDVKGGPYTELRLAPTAIAVVVALIFRWRITEPRPMWRIVGDALKVALYEVRAHGVRIQDRHAASVLVGGIPRLRTEGEDAHRLLVETAEERELVAPQGVGALEREGSEKDRSSGWTLLERDFERTIAAVEVPEEGMGYPVKVDWSLVASIPRLEMLLGGPLQISYRRIRVRFRDLFALTDVGGNPAGLRFAYYLARETAHDLFSLRKQQTFADWLRFASSLLAFLGGLGGLSWLVSETISDLF